MKMRLPIFTACHTSKFLYGPACLRLSRVVIYPCYRNKCVCPCRFCSVPICPELDILKKMKHELQCSNCNTVFSTKQNLNIHVQNQSANPCGQCSAIFCNAHALKCMPYSDQTCKKCHICGVDYEYLNLHIESVHDNTSKTK